MHTRSLWVIGPSRSRGFSLTGLTKVPQIYAALSQQYGWLETLLGSIVNIAAGIAGVFGGPPAALATSILGNSIVNPLDAYLNGAFNDGNKPIDSVQNKYVERGCRCCQSDAKFLE